jgi:O-antigen ligase
VARSPRAEASLSSIDHSVTAASRSVGPGFGAARPSAEVGWPLRSRRLVGTTSIRSANVEILLRQIVFLVLLSRSVCDPIFEMSGVNLGGAPIGFGAAINALVIAVAMVFAIQRFHIAGTIVRMWGPYLLLVFCATLYAPNVTIAARISFVVLSYAAMFALPLFMFRSAEDLRRFILLILASSIVPTLYGVWDLRHALSDPDEFRLQSTFSHANIFAFYLVLLIGLALYIRTSTAGVWSSRIRTLVTAYIPVLLVLLAMTKTRSAWGAAAMMFLIYAIWFDRRLLVAVLVVPVLLSSHTIGGRLADLSGGEEIENFSQLNSEVRLNSLAWRQALWESALPHIAARPVLGHGVESFRPMTPRFFPLIGPGGIDAHNVYLQILYEMGAIGLLAYAWLIVSIVRCLRRGRRYDANGIVMIYTLVGAYLLESYSDNMIYYLSFNWYFMFAIGTICAWIVYQEGPDRAAGRVSVRGPRPVSRPTPANADS